jgi:hypothetical protein
VSAATITPILPRAAASFIFELLPLVPLLVFGGGARTGIRSYAFCSASVWSTLHSFVLSYDSLLLFKCVLVIIFIVNNNFLVLK